MRAKDESRIEAAVRCVRRGRERIQRQMRVIARRQQKDLPIARFEDVLCWLEQTQHRFGKEYCDLFFDGTEKIETWKAGSEGRQN